jgi:GH15 family glucan-1,4-alpha-glucosidase
MDLQRSGAKLLSELLRAAPGARLPSSYPAIADLGVIGDRHTAAAVTRAGEIVWYCPGRFDAPSLLGGLLDPAVAGSWRVDLPGAKPLRRRYLDESAVLETTLHHPNGRLGITDWMTLPHQGVPRGMLCRSLTAAPAALRLVLTPRPDYGHRVPRLRRGTPNRVVIDDRFHLHASHPAHIRGASIEVRVPKGERAWAALSDAAASTVLVSEVALRQWLSATRDGWRELASRRSYDGPYQREVHASLRALRLLLFEETGAIAASVTTSLPEVVGGKRNYDYRYTWLRDSGMVVRALTRFEPDGMAARRHLGFVAGVRGTGYREPLDPVSAIGGERVPMQSRLKLAGYRHSRPSLVGNRAAKQLQLGSLANFLLAARETYERLAPREHWEVVAATADFLAENWARRDSGIWEEQRPQQFTASKAFTACALEGIAKFAPDRARAEAYRAAAGEIRAYVARSCRTRAGGYAAVAGTNAVDISAALLPVWGYTTPDDPAMDATIHELERKYCPGGNLYHRHLEKARAQRREGAFLAGTFWVAHYWVVRGDLGRASRMIDAGLSHANDLGLFPEEIDARSGRMLGNIPLGLVHASFLSVVADYNERRGR